MTALAMIVGKPQGEPVTRDTRNGGMVTFFKLRVVNGSELEYWDVATFSDTAREELDGLEEGDAVSAVGALRIEPHERGEMRGFNRQLTADRVLALKSKPKEAIPKAEKPARRAAPAKSASTAAASVFEGRAELDDSVPF